MSISNKLIQAASGNAGSDNLYVEDVFSTYLYTGNSSTQNITNGLDLAGEGGMVWHKRRTYSGENHYLYDTERGAAKSLRPNGTNAENATGTGGLTSFNSDGYTYGTAQETDHDYVGWSFRKAEKFFDVVHETVGSSGTVSHNLGSTPGMIIRKRVDDTQNWFVWHRRLTSGTLVYLDLNIAEDSSPGINTVTDSSFGHSGSAGEYVWYVFAHNAGGFGDDENESIITCGSYTGTGSSGLDVNLGWEPQYLLVKNVDNTDDWWVVDSMRGVTTGGNDPYLKPNKSDYEEGGQDTLTFGARGFTIETFGGMVNESGSKYIYMAIRRPMKTPTEGTEVFAPTAYNGTEPTPQYLSTGFTVDFNLYKYRNLNIGASAFDRLRGSNNALTTSSSNAEEDISGNSASQILAKQFERNDGFSVGTGANNAAPLVAYSFKRAPGFMDVVCFTGDSGNTNQRVSHNLTVVPELIIYKGRNKVNYWRVYSGRTDQYIALNVNSAISTWPGFWGTSAPTATDFGFNPGLMDLDAFNAVAYLFATLAGVSKVGSFAHTQGTATNVDCGFANGARFVLWKRTDGSDGWQTYDSVRGIVAGPDPFIQLNSNSVELTEDLIDPLAAGFSVASGKTSGNYIFLAIA